MTLFLLGTKKAVDISTRVMKFLVTKLFLGITEESFYL